MLHGPVREHGGEEEKQGAERGVARAGSSGSSIGSSVALQRTPGYRRRRGQASQRAPLPPKKHRSASDRRGDAYFGREEQRRWALRMRSAVLWPTIEQKRLMNSLRRESLQAGAGRARA